MPHYVRVIPVESSNVLGTGPSPHFKVDTSNNIVGIQPPPTGLGARRPSIAGGAGKESTLKRRLSTAQLNAETSIALTRPIDSESYKCTAVYPTNMDGDEVAKVFGQILTPTVVKRNNVTVILHGQVGTGKSYFAEKLLEPLLESFKAAVASADEAHQESIAAGIADGSPSGGGAGITQTNSLLEKQQVKRASTAPLPEDQSMMSTVEDRLVATITENSKAMARPNTSMKKSPGRSTSPNQSRSEVGFVNEKISITFGPPGSPFGKQKTKEFFGTIRGGNLPAMPLIPTIKGFTEMIQQKAEKDDDGANVKSAAATSTRGKLLRLSARKPMSVENDHIVPVGNTHNSFGKGPLTVALFPGVKNCLTVPTIPNLDQLLQKGSFEFWFRVDADAKQSMCLMSISDTKSPGISAKIMIHTAASGEFVMDSYLFSVSDVNQRACEAILHEDIPKDTWHHLVWEIKNVRENQMVIHLNGKAISRVRIVTVDSPSTFGPFAQRFTLGGSVLDNPQGPIIQNPFKGQIASMRMLLGEKVVGLYMMSYFDGIDKIPEIVGRLPPLESAPGMFFSKYTFPPTALTLNGDNAYVNIGSLGDFGLALNSFTVEISFKTSCQSERMCLVGVLDDVAKHQGFGIDVNVNVHSQFHRTYFSFWVRDFRGIVLRCGTELPDAIDDKWHTLTWRVIDAVTGKMKIRVDNRPVELDPVCINDGPNEFMSFHQWIAIGAMNKRGKVSSNFKGCIRQARFIRVFPEKEETFAMYPFDEGPHARVAIDSTGHGFHGSFYSDGSRYSSWHLVENENEEDTISTLQHADMNIVRFSNNVVKMAYLAFIVGPNSLGVMTEVIYDLFKGVPVRMGLQPLANKRSPACENRMMPCLPSECFVTVSGTTYLEKFALATKALNNFRHKCHTMFVFKLGDAHFTLLDLQGVSLTSKARFDDKQLVWVDTLNNFGVENKAKIVMNRSMNNVEKTLLHVGSYPQLYKRTTLLHVKTPIRDANGVLASVVQSHLIGGVEFSSVHMVHTFNSNPTKDEVLAEVLLMKQMHAQAKVYASIAIQKNWRAKMARKRHSRLDGLRAADRRREERVATIRKQFPAQSACKEKKRALLIGIGYFDDSRLRPLDHVDDDILDVSRTLDKLGYVVEVMASTPPNRQNILDLIAKYREKTDEQFIVYIAGYAVQGAYYVTPKNSHYMQWLAEDEKIERSAIEVEMSREYVDLEKEEEAEATRVAEEVRIKEEELAKKKKKAKPKPGAKQDAKPKPEEKKEETKKKKEKKQEAKEEDIVKEEAVVEDAPDVLGNNTFFLCQDTPLTFSEQNTILLSDFIKKVCGTEPTRGVHTALIFDFTWFGPTTGSTGYGICGAATSGQEKITIQLKSSQRGLLSYYFKKALAGNSAAAVTVGKREPPTNITTTTLGMHLRKKLYGERAPLQMDHVLGEYVGDILLAPKILSSKADRKKIKIEDKNKRLCVKIVCMFKGHVVMGSDPKKYFQDKLSSVLRDPNLELRRIQIADVVELYLDGDPNLAFFKPRTKSLIEQDVRSMFSTGNTTFKLKFSPLSVQVSQRGLLSTFNFGAMGDDGQPKDQKTIAREFASFFQTQNGYGVTQADSVVRTEALATSLGGFPVVGVEGRFQAVAMVLQNQYPKLDRMFRAGVEIIPGVRMLAVHTMADGDTERLNQEDAVLALYEQLRVQDEKMRVAREAEAQRKREEAQLAINMKAAKALSSLEDMRGAINWTPEMVRDIFVVQHKDLYLASIELMTSLTNTLPTAPAIISDTNLIPYVLDAFTAFPECRDKALRFFAQISAMPVENVQKAIHTHMVGATVVDAISVNMKERIPTFQAVGLAAKYLCPEIGAKLRSSEGYEKLLVLLNIATEPEDLARLFTLLAACVEPPGMGSEKDRAVFFEVFAFLKKVGTTGPEPVLAAGLQCLWTAINPITKEDVESKELCPFFHSMAEVLPNFSYPHMLWVQCLTLMPPAPILYHQKANALIRSFAFCKSNQDLCMTIIRRFGFCGQMGDERIKGEAQRCLQEAIEAFPSEQDLQGIVY